MVEIKNLTKVYKTGSSRVNALKNVNINFPDNGLIIILGKSGCGKSTFINMLGGLDKPTSGEILVNGTDITKLKGADFDAYRNTYVGVVFQEFNLIEDQTVYDNISITLKLAEQNTDVATVDEVLEQVGLNNLGYRKPSELSGGQRQRVALARTLIKKPEIILADEPTGALDSITGEEVFESLKKISKNKLVIVVTHNKDLAYTYGDRIVYMKDGEFIEDLSHIKDDDTKARLIAPNLIEVSTNNQLTAEELNSVIDNEAKNNPNSEIYVGINYDKDRVALAYSDSVEKIYAKSAAQDYKETEVIDTNTDNEFKLSRGKMKISDCITYAKGNNKKFKKRSKLIVFLTSIVMAFLAFSLMLSFINIPSLVSKTAFEKDAPNVVQISGKEKTLSEKDINNIKSAFSNSKIGYIAKVDAKPLFIKTKNQMNFGDMYSNSIFEIDKINGIIEGATPEELGYEMIKGSKVPQSMDELVISDLLAFEFTRSGIVGKDKNGEEGLYYPKDIEDCIGYSFSIDNIEDKVFKIVGIFDTNYEEYKDFVIGNLDWNTRMKRQRAFGNNLDFIYGKVFAKKGMGQYFESKLVSNKEFILTSNQNNENRYIATFKIGDVYSPSMLDKYYDQNGKNTPPDTLKKDEIIIDFSVMQMLIGNMAREKGEHYDYVFTCEELIKKPEYKQIFSQNPYLINISLRSDFNYVEVLTNRPIKIVGMTDMRKLGLKQNIIFNEFLQKEITNINLGYSSVFVKKFSTKGAMSSKLSEIRKDDLLCGTSQAGILGMEQLKERVDAFKKIGVYIALATSIFVFFIILNYMVHSIQFRSKEISILRLIGAKKFDIAKIFLVEGFLLSLRMTLIGSIFNYIIVSIYNKIMGALLYELLPGLTILAFTPLTVIMIFAITLVFVLISSLIPIFNIIKKKPVDAIKVRW